MTSASSTGSYIKISSELSHASKVSITPHLCFLAILQYHLVKKVRGFFVGVEGSELLTVLP